ncbi:MAG: cobalamin-dependent protein [Gammaproteobacteria bacterium]|nr:cobalamin-dependent protein [Gammaproteobacteria bacterium]
MIKREITIPLSDQGLLVLERDADDISREVTDSYFEMHPECYRGNADKIRAMCKVDFAHHLKFLTSAMVTATPEIFVEYTQWLKEVLKSRLLSLQHPIDSFTLMLIYIKRRLNDSDRLIATQVIESGLETLKNDQVEKSHFQQSSEKSLNVSPDYALSLVEGDRKQAEAIIKNSTESGVSLIDVEVGIVQPAMYEIGNMWQQNKITVAQEHLATAISQNALARAFATADFADPVDRSTVCACIEGNFHSMGLRMVSDAFELSGWDVDYLGSDTPNSSIVSQVDAVRPDVLSLSLSLPHQIIVLKQLIEQLQAEMGSQMPSIVVGGLAFNNHRTLTSRVDVDNWYIDAKAVMDDIKK